MAFNISRSTCSALKSCNWTSTGDANDTSQRNIALEIHNHSYPLLLLICVLGNCISLCILPKGRSTSVTSLFLIAMAAADIFVVLLYMDLYLTGVHPDIFKNEALLSVRIYHFFKGFVRWFRATCLQFSDCALIAFSLVRWLIVSDPLKYRTISRRKVKVLLLCLLGAAAVFNTETLAFEYHFWANDDGVSRIDDINGCALRIWHVVQEHIEIVLTIGKWLTIVVINTIIAYNLHTGRNSRKGAPLVDAIIEGRDAQTATNNRILLGCAILYTLTQIPNALNSVFVRISRPPWCLVDYKPLEQYVFPLANVVLLTNYTFNFVVYCVVSSKYREQLLKVKRKILHRTQSHESSSSTATQNFVLY